MQKKKKRKFKTFKEFDNGTTDSYPPPEHVVQPAKDDKGYAIVKNAFNKIKRIYQPGISI